jgi:hypothetical protein
LSQTAESLAIELRQRELRKRRDAVKAARDKLWNEIHSGHAQTESRAEVRARELLAKQDGPPAAVKQPSEKLRDLEAELAAFDAAGKLLADEARHARMAALRQHVAALLPQYREHARDLARALRTVAAANAAIEGIRDALWQFSGALPTVGGLPYAAIRGEDRQPLTLSDPQSALPRWFATALRDGLLDAADLPPEVRDLLESPRGSAAPAEAKRASARRFY